MSTKSIKENNANSRKVEKEVRKVHDLFWKAYAKRDIDLRFSLCSDEVTFIGSGLQERATNKNEYKKINKAGVKQFPNAFKIKFLWIHLTMMKEHVACVESEVVWSQLINKKMSKELLRNTTILKFEKNKWLVTHVHGSVPDYRLKEGDYMTNEQTIIRNKELEQQVFERTNDLKMTLEEIKQKNLELEIESALEKVRTIAMGMKEPADMLDVCKTISLQLESLGIKEIRNVQTAIFYEKRGTYMNYEFYAKHDKTVITETTYTNNKLHEEFALKMIKGKGEIFITHIKGKEVKDWIAYQKTTNVFIDSFLETASSLNYYWFSLGPVALGISTYHPLTGDEINLFKRFLRVFELAYQRYLDIEKAEAQAREAQVQLALERVRARSLAMHHTSELQEVVNILAQQLHNMNFDINGGVFIAINDEVDKDIPLWASGGAADYLQKVTVPFLNKPVFTLLRDALKRKNNFFTEEHGQEEKIGFFEHLFKHPPWNSHSQQRKQELVSREGGYTRSVAISQHTSISITNHNGKKFSDDDNEILKRFGNVFEQSYIRFLDLQKAEAQAKEAKIEAALERVRSRTMGMQKSEELKEVIQIVYEQFVHLNINTEHAGFILDYEERDDYHSWIADKFGSPSQITLPYFDCIYYNRFNEAKENGIDFFATTLNLEEKNRFYEDLFKNIPGFPEESKQIIFSKPGFTISTVLLENVALYIENFTGIPYSDEENAILMRFGKVFQQTYTRFLDLQKAEAQAREAIKQASLDRVRGEIASMRTSEDLNRITPIIWRELKTLDVPFIRCGVFIVNEVQEIVHVYLTTPNGKSLGVLHLSFYANELTSSTVDYWRKKQVYKEHWNKEQFINWTNSLIEIGQVQNAETYQGSLTPPASLHLHFVPFAQGMLYVGDVSPLLDEKLELVKTLAEAFSIAYARYEDFKNLEEAKNKVEITLNELKSAQAQLIHSEKMASLGELTAGIAHEIKNPLNFVNNFSEVSRELLDEMKIELKENKIDDVIEIIEDLKQNLDKINQHGKRADAIVKGMLLHSRGSSGEKMLTDINDLLDQFVILAYHGMRAQNKEFNITIEKDYDKTLEKLNVVPQDISRVFLNIINNACYAAYDKKLKSRDNNFSPTLKVSTKNLDDFVEIKIADNGNGIPKIISDKIFQPFFTTKPTGEGTGLGLSISYDVVTKVHGGELKVVTKELEGAEFIIMLPKV